MRKVRRLYKPKLREYSDYAPPFVVKMIKTNNRNPCYHQLAHPIFSDMMFASTVSRRATDVHKYMLQTPDELELSQ